MIILLPGGVCVHACTSEHFCNTFYKLLEGAEAIGQIEKGVLVDEAILHSVGFHWSVCVQDVCCQQSSSSLSIFLRTNWTFSLQLNTWC